ncbi:hypothetical protein OPQ81_011895 [Rhizoctonia solani]|nr:hypothetical protein OPQ81_011895 [Rhizoctonia solani]
MGWTAEDMNFDYLGCTNKGAWLELVSHPKLLNERGWMALRSKLTPLLQTNRERRLEAGRQTRKQKRKARLSEPFRKIKKQSTLSLEGSVPNPDSISTDVLYEPPFPSFSHILDFPVVPALYETNQPVAEMETKFEQNRKVIDGYITEWNTRVHARFTNLVNEGPKVTKPILQSASSSDKNMSDLFAKFGDDAKRLLRANSFFSTETFSGWGETMTILSGATNSGSYYLAFRG